MKAVNPGDDQSPVEYERALQLVGAYNMVRDMRGVPSSQRYILVESPDAHSHYGDFLIMCLDDTGYDQYVSDLEMWYLEELKALSLS